MKYGLLRLMIPGVYLSVARFTRVHCANTAEPIEVFVGVRTLGGPRHSGLDGGEDSMRPSPNYFDHLFMSLSNLQFSETTRAMVKLVSCGYVLNCVDRRMLLEDQARSDCVTLVVSRQSPDRRSTIKFDSIGTSPEGYQHEANHVDVRDYRSSVNFC